VAVTITWRSAEPIPSPSLCSGDRLKNLLELVFDSEFPMVLDQRHKSVANIAFKASGESVFFEIHKLLKIHTEIMLALED